MDKHQISEITAAREYADSQLTKEELAERDARHEAAHVNINEAYFAKQEALAEQIAAQNAKNAAAQKERDKGAAERRRAENEANMSAHHAGNKPPEGFLDMAGTIPCKRNAPISLQPRPDSYPPSDPRHAMSEADIIGMGMSLDGPATKVEAPHAPTAEEQEAAVQRMNVHLSAKQQ